MAGSGLRLYDRRLKASRHDMGKRLDRLYASCGTDRLPGFLIQFSAIGATLVKRVPEWIERARQACRQRCLEIPGPASICDPEEERGHDQWYRHDLEALIRRFAPSSKDRIEEIIADASRASCIAQYVRVNEGAITGPFPLEWFSIQYEIELLSLALGPRFIAHTVRELGPEILTCLSFVSGHGGADIEHARENVGLMNRLLESWPGKVESFVRVGQDALESYIRYFEESLERSGLVEAL
ncbi:MAG: hypothetical protein HY549_03160 [Elusimicrobia bacterium]|nr:hypothetical protein [Elusimicrobiota bacterium]